MRHIARKLIIMLLTAVLVCTAAVSYAEESVTVEITAVEPDALPSAGNVLVTISVNNKSDYELQSITVSQNGISYPIPEDTVIPHLGKAIIPITVSVQDSQIGVPIVFSVGWTCDGEPHSAEVETTIEKTEEPVITLLRTASETHAKPGEKVLMTYTIKNETRFDMTEIMLVDEEICNEPIRRNDSLQASNTLTFEYSYTVGTEDAVSNPVITYSVNGSSKSLTPLEPLTIQSVNIGAQIKAQAGAVSSAGTTVDLTVTNTGNQKLKDVRVTDDSGTPVNTVPFSLSAGEKQYLTYSVSNPDGRPSRNIRFSLTATDPFGEQFETVSQDPLPVSFYIDASQFSVTMQAAQTADITPDGYASFSVQIDNSSSSPLSNVELSEASSGLLATYLTLPNGQTRFEGQLFVSDPKTLEFSLRGTDSLNSVRDLAKCTLTLSAAAGSPSGEQTAEPGIAGTVTPEPGQQPSGGISGIVTRILIVLGAVVILACAVLLVLSLLERNHIGENAFLQEIADDGEFDEDFDQPAVRLDDDGYEDSGYGGPDDYFRRSQLFISEREKRRKESARTDRQYGRSERNDLWDDEFDYTQPVYQHELNQEEEYVYRRPSAFSPNTAARAEDEFLPLNQDSDLNDSAKDAVFEEMFYDMAQEEEETVLPEREENTANQAPKAIRVKNVPAQRKLRKDTVKRVKSEELPGSDETETEEDYDSDDA